MTPLPDPAELASRPLFNPSAGLIHVRDLVELTFRTKNLLSDHIIGVLVVGAHVGSITKTQGDRFESDFVRGLKIRKAHVPAGEPFLGPDGLVMVLQGRALRGGYPHLGVSPLTLDTMAGHPNYNGWLNTIIFGRRGRLGSVTRSGHGQIPYNLNDHPVAPLPGTNTLQTSTTFATTAVFSQPTAVAATAASVAGPSAAPVANVNAANTPAGPSTVTTTAGNTKTSQESDNELSELSDSDFPLTWIEGNI